MVDSFGTTTSHASHRVGRQTQCKGKDGYHKLALHVQPVNALVKKERETGDDCDIANTKMKHFAKFPKLEASKIIAPCIPDQQVSIKSSIKIRNNGKNMNGKQIIYVQAFGNAT